MSKKKIDIPVPPVPLEQLRMIRKTEGYTLESISEVLDIDRGTYTRYEKGITPIPSNILIRLSQVLRVSTDFILGLDTHLNKGNDEFMKYTGLNETSIETLRKLFIDDIALRKFQAIGLTMGAPLLTALSHQNTSVLNILLSNPDDFERFATAFIHYADNDFTHPVRRELQQDGTDKWVPLEDNQLGLCTNLSKLEDSVTIRFNEDNLKAIHKNTLDILINRYADKYHQETHKKLPILKK